MTMICPICRGFMRWCDEKYMCPVCGYDDTPKPTIITNADRIRSMTDEELAEFLYNVWKEQDTFSKEVCERCGDTDIGCQPNCWLDWLRKEEESEGEVNV